MGTTQVDALQTAQIIALQTDVAELREKLNLAISDELALSSKLNTLIDDLNDMNNLIMEGYTVPGSPESYGILEGMDVYKDEYKDHVETVGSDTTPYGSSGGTPSWTWWPAITSLSGGNTGNYNASDISGTLTGASWSSGSNAVSFTGTTGTIREGQRLQNSGSEVGQVKEGSANGAMIASISGSTLYLSDGFSGLDKWYLTGSGTLSFVAKAGTIHYGVYYDNYWTDIGPWAIDWFEHPRMNRSGYSMAKSGSAGASSYDNPALDGTGQSGNVANTSTVADNASVTGLYESYTENLLGLEPEAAIRAKKLVRNILKKIRKK